MRQSRKAIIILAVIAIILCLIGGIFPAGGANYRLINQIGMPVVFVRFVASILFLVFCITVNRVPELTVIPVGIIIADYISYYVQMLIRLPQMRYPMRLFFRETRVDVLGVLLMIVFLVIYFLAISSKIKNRAVARTLTGVFAILSFIPSIISCFLAFRIARTLLLTSGIEFMAEAVMIIAMLLCVSRFTRDMNAQAKAEAVAAKANAPVQVAAAPVASSADKPLPHASSSSLWENDYLIVDEKVRAFTFGNAYGIYADGTDPVGYVQQVNISGGAKAAQIMLGSKMKAMQNIEIVITDASGSRVGGISRKGISFIAIEDAAGNVIGHLKFGKIVTDDGRVLATAKTKSLSKTSILDENGAEMAMIDHKWNGVKSLLTSADKYAVLFANDLDSAKKSNVLAICIAFDFVTD